jgi:hypothetical protein
VPKLTTAELPVLFDALSGAGLKLVDVGGRGDAMPQLRSVASVASYYTCEPDLGESARLREHLIGRGEWRDVVLITESIGSRPAQATLYLTRQPGMSSLLEPDPRRDRPLLPAPEVRGDGDGIRTPGAAR